MFYNTKLKDAPSYVLPELAQLCGSSKKETVPEEDSPFQIEDIDDNDENGGT